MEEMRYARNIGPVTPQEAAVLRQASVFVAGLGGLGGYVVEELARTGVRRIVFADGDVWQETNLNRQLLCEEAVLGQKKAHTAAERVKRINSDVQVTAYDTFLTAENADALLLGCDIAVDALDNIPVRRVLLTACEKRGIPLVHAAVDGWRAQVTVIPPGGKAFDVLYPDGAAVAPSGTLACTPAVAASVEAAETVKLLLGRTPTLAGKLLLIDLSSLTFEQIALPT